MSLQEKFLEIFTAADYNILLELLEESISSYKTSKSESDRHMISLLCAVILNREIEESRDKLGNKRKDLPPDIKDIADKFKRGEL